MLLVLACAALAEFRYEGIPSSGDGQQRLEAMQTEAVYQTPCWKAALARLETTCRSMDDDAQSRLAIEFTNCHLSKSGLPTYQCNASDSLADCTEPMAHSNGLAYNVYTHFFTHAESICFYIQSQAFQEQAEITINRLERAASDSSLQLQAIQSQAAEVLQGVEAAKTMQEDVLHTQQQFTTQMEGMRAEEAARFSATQQSLQNITALSETIHSQAVQSAEVQGQLLTGQHAALSAQAQLLADQRSASEALASLSNQSSAVLERVNLQQEAFEVQHAALLGQLSRVLSLLQAVAGEVVDVKAFIFYSVSFVLAVVFTAMKRTQAARPQLFLLLCFTWGLERWLVSDHGDQPFQEVAWRLWLVRKVASSACVLLVVRAAAGYRDPMQHCLHVLDQVERNGRQLSQQFEDLLKAQGAAHAHESALSEGGEDSSQRKVPDQDREGECNPHKVTDQVPEEECSQHEECRGVKAIPPARRRSNRFKY